MKKHCVFLMEDWPLAPDAPGGAGPLCYAHLALLARTGWQIWLVILADEKAPKGFARFMSEQPDVWQQVQSWCRQHTILPITRSHIKTKRERAAAFFRQPDRLFINPVPQLLHSLHEQARQAQPNLIWAEHLLPATLAAQALGTGKLVYSQHDWHWRIKTLRYNNGGWRRRLAMNARRRHEEHLVRTIRGLVSASASEAAQLARLSGKPTGYFPTTYQPLKLSSSLPEDNLCLVHLGGMQTTANRIGLARFLQVSWPIICRELPAPPELWVVGSLSGASMKLQETLRAANATCTGYVADLAQVLRPFDLQIVPWEYDTGTRTRIPLAMNHGQVIISTRAAAACLPELQHDQNAILTEDLEQMAHEIIALYADVNRRERLALNGRETFLGNYTIAAQQPRLEKFLAYLQ